MAARKKLFLIDAMGFLFRAHYAPMERLRSPAGVPTKVPYLFAGMLRRLLKNYAPDYVAAVFDPRGPTFRDRLFAEYKAQRAPMPEELAQQIPYVERLCDALRLARVVEEGYEADDVIGALAAQAEKKGFEVYIVTADKDMLQLVTRGAARGGRGRKGNILVLRSSQRSGEEREVNAAGVEEILGVPPEKVVDLMALMGDAIDNIPGAKGIGEKGAVELIRRFGTVEAALERAAEVENKRYREALQQQREQVLLSKKLAAISTDMPIRLDLEAMRARPADPEALRALYSELGFTSLLKELGPAEEEVAGAGQAALRDVATIATAAELLEFLRAIPPGCATSVWLTLAPEQNRDAGPGFGSRVMGVEVCAQAGVVRRVPWAGDAAPSQREFEAVGEAQGPAGGAKNEPEIPGGSPAKNNPELVAALSGWLADESQWKTTHDPKLLHLLLGPTAGVRHAAALYSYLLRPTTTRHGLEDIVLRTLGRAPGSEPGAAADALLRAAPLLRAEVEKQGLAEVYERIDLPLAPVLARMEPHGVGVDPEALAALSAVFEAEVRGLEKRIWELAGARFNVNSPPQLGQVLFDRLKLEPPARRGRTRGGARSTSAEVLESLAEEHEIARLVLDYREISKLKSTYADALPKLIHPATRRIHTRLSQTGTATGRLSSSDPNLQNIPVRTELGRQIRAAFTAAPGCALLSADYSQIELRLLAHFSRDPALLEAFRRGEDIHARTAQEVFGVGPMAQTAEHRRVAKVINFGIIYGLSSFGLAQQLGVPQKEAAAFIAAYFARYPGVREYLEGSIQAARQTGVSRTLFGRVRPIPEISSPQQSLRSFAERTALNTPLQGTAADLIKLAMVEIDRRLREDAVLAARDAAGAPAARMILQVHDELLFEVRAEALERLRALVKREMEAVQPFEGELLAPLVVETRSGPNWRDLS
jgi:DNA polymerase-1